MLEAPAGTQAAYLRKSLIMVKQIPERFVSNSRDFVLDSQPSFTGMITVGNFWISVVAIKRQNSYNFSIFHTQLYQPRPFFGVVEETGTAYSFGTEKWNHQPGVSLIISRSFLEPLIRLMTICHHQN